MEQSLMQAMAVVQTFVHGSADVEETLRELSILAAATVGADMAGLTVATSVAAPPPSSTPTAWSPRSTRRSTTSTEAHASTPPAPT